MPEKTVPKGETKVLIPDGEASRVEERNEQRRKKNKDPIQFQVTPADGDVRIAHGEGEAHKGQTFEKGRPALINPFGEAIYVYAPNTETTVEWRLASFDVTLFPPMVARAGRQNQPRIAGDKITPGSSGATFRSLEVPDGFEVLVQNQHGSDDVYVQADDGSGGTLDSILIPAGGSVTLGVNNLDVITVTGTSNNPPVTATVEAGYQ